MSSGDFVFVDEVPPGRAKHKQMLRTMTPRLWQDRMMADIKATFGEACIQTVIMHLGDNGKPLGRYRKHYDEHFRNRLVPMPWLDGQLVPRLFLIDATTPVQTDIGYTLPALAWGNDMPKVAKMARAA